MFEKKYCNSDKTVCVDEKFLDEQRQKWRVASPITSKDPCDLYYFPTNYGRFVAVCEFAHEEEGEVEIFGNEIDALQFCWEWE